MRFFHVLPPSMLLPFVLASCSTQVSGGGGGAGGSATSTSTDASATSTGAGGSAASTGADGSTSTDASASTGAGGSAASASASTGAAVVCAPLSIVACYGGPAATQGIGSCSAGTQTCLADGSGYGACVGEVRPATESCATSAIDESCDGAPGCDGACRWNKRFGDGNGSATAGSLVVDAEGSAIVAFEGVGSADFGGGALSLPGLEIWIAKLDSAGDHLWSKVFGVGYGAGLNQIGAAAGLAGEVILTGTFTGTIDLGGGPLTSQGGSDLFVAKLDRDGHLVWNKRFAVNSPAPQPLGASAVVDAAGDVILSAFAPVGVDFGGGALPYAGGSSDTFIVKLSPSGDHLWSKAIGSSSYDVIGPFAVDPAGRVVLAGLVSAPADLGSGVVLPPGEFLLALDAAGAVAWARSPFAAGAASFFSSLAVDPAGNVVAAGIFDGQVDLGAGPLTSTMKPGGMVPSKDFVVLGLAPDGSTRFSKSFGSSLDEFAPFAVAVDGAGQIVLGGLIQADVDFGGGALPAQGETGFLAKLDGDGKHLWSKSYATTTQFQQIIPVAVGPGGEIVASSTFTGTVDFGCGPLDAGGQHIAVVSLRP